MELMSFRVLAPWHGDRDRYIVNPGIVHRITKPFYFKKDKLLNPKCPFINSKLGCILKPERS